MEGSAVGKARLTGLALGDAGTFAVDLVVEGRLDEGEPGYAETCRAFFLRLGCGSSAGWRVYTALSGTLTGVAGAVDGAVYSVSLGTPPPAPTGLTQCDGGDPANPVLQVGIGANTRAPEFGAFAPLSLVLAQDNGMGLPAIMDGVLSLDMPILNAIPPTPSPDLTGTWQGSIDCAGIADFTDTESFSGPVELKVGEPVGYSYGVELSDGGGVIATYCAEYSGDLAVDSGRGTGRMINGDPAQPPTTVFLRARNNPAQDPTLKAREFFLLPDGLGDEDLLPDGLNFCKWTFTQTDPAPAFAGGCPSACGDGVVDFFEQCDDGNNVDLDGCSFTCLLSIVAQ